MECWRIVLLKISAMFVLILAGWMLRRKEWIGPEMTRALGRILVDVVFPSLVFVQMIRTVDPVVLQTEWIVPLIAVLTLTISYLIGSAVQPVLGGKADGVTFRFLAAMPNWIFIPLPIIEALYGNEGVRFVLLFNFGTQVLMWTVGIALVSRVPWGRTGALQLAKNPGLWATVIGIAVAVLIPQARQLESIGRDTSLPVYWFAGGALIQAMAMLGSLTIPLSLLITGAQLGALPLSHHRPSRPVIGILTVRLILAPAIAVGIIQGLAHVGFVLPEVTRMSTYVIIAMPVAVSCTLIIERFGGDSALSALSIFQSTLCSLVTVPLWVWVCTKFHL